MLLTDLLFSGMMYTAAAPFALTGPVIAGHLISNFGYNFVTVQCWAGGCLLVSSFCMAMAVICDENSEEKELSGNNTPRSRLSSMVSTSMSFWSKKEEA